MNKRVIAAIVAALLAVLGGALLFGYVQSADARAMLGQQPTTVLVVSAPIAKGTQGEQAKSSVAVRQLPATAVVAGALTSPDQLTGKVASTDLVPGEQVLASRFVDPTSPEVSDPVAVPAGMQTLSIVLAPQRVIGSHLKAGDYVGVIMSFEFQNPAKDQPTIKTTHLTLSRVLVTRVAGVTATDASKDTGTTAGTAPDASVMVSLAVKAPDAEKIVFAAEWGKVWLSLQREGTDNNGIRIVTGGNIYK